MAGNSSRRGAVRTGATRKGPTVGSGGQQRQGLEARGPTPKASERTGHPAARKAAAAARRKESGKTGAATFGPARSSGKPAAGRTSAGKPATGKPATGRPATGRPATGAAQSRGIQGRGTGGRATRRPSAGAPEVVAGRNPVVEALRAGVPVKAVYVASRIDHDERVREALKLAADRHLPLLEVSRLDLDRMTDGAIHQGLVAQVPPYEYAHPDDLLGFAADAEQPALLVALDGVTDPRNLGAVVRSVAAFGGHGVIVPERRAAGMTASAWKVSAGAAARVPVARATNLTRTLQSLKASGCFVVGLDADGSLELPQLEAAVEPLVLVVGSEGKGLGRLVRATCDVVVSIPMAAGTESLNAGVAAGVALYEVARRRQA
jgi:23S rRNA (guanosine2251-2'-O)-methyltransferase